MIKPEKEIPGIVIHEFLAGLELEREITKARHHFIFGTRHHHFLLILGLTSETGNPGGVCQPVVNLDDLPCRRSIGEIFTDWVLNI